jgi:hypothetical protein
LGIAKFLGVSQQVIDLAADEHRYKAKSRE